MPCQFPEHHRASGGRGLLVLIAVLLTAVALGTSATAARIAADLRDVLVWMAGTLVAVLVVAVALMVREWRRARADARALPPAAPAVHGYASKVKDASFTLDEHELPADELAARRASRRAG
jgi:hypothetical protein